MKKLVITLLSIWTIQTQALTLQEIKNQDIIRIGVSGTKPPFGFVGGVEGDSIGFEADLAREMAKDLLGRDDRIDFILLESSDRIPALEKDEVDVVLANFTITKARQQKVDFAEPYIRTRLGILSPQNNLITELSQLAGKTLIVPQGTIAETYFQTHYPKVKLKTYEDNASAFINFRKGSGDALSQDNTLLFPWAKENPDFVVSIAGFGDEFLIAPAVQKDNQELLDFVNKEITKFRSNGVIDQAYEKYFRPAFSDSAKKENILVQ